MTNAKTVPKHVLTNLKASSSDLIQVTCYQQELKWRCFHGCGIEASQETCDASGLLCMCMCVCVWQRGEKEKWFFLEAGGNKVPPLSGKDMPNTAFIYISATNLAARTECMSPKNVNSRILNMNMDTLGKLAAPATAKIR